MSAVAPLLASAASSASIVCFSCGLGIAWHVISAYQFVGNVVPSVHGGAVGYPPGEQAALRVAFIELHRLEEGVKAVGGGVLVLRRPSRVCAVGAGMNRIRHVL